jgi:hypothetical protein
VDEISKRIDGLPAEQLEKVREFEKTTRTARPLSRRSTAR